MRYIRNGLLLSFSFGQNSLAGKYHVRIDYILRMCKCLYLSVCVCICLTQRNKTSTTRVVIWRFLNLHTKCPSSLALVYLYSCVSAAVGNLTTTKLIFCSHQDSSPFVHIIILQLCVSVPILCYIEHNFLACHSL